MRSILLDENVPVGVAARLADKAGLIVSQVPELGLGGADDSEVLAAACEKGFDVLVTCDQKIPTQQNLSAFPIAVVIVCTNNWATIRGNIDVIAEHCLTAQSRTFVEVLKGLHWTRYGRSPKMSDAGRDAK